MNGPADGIGEARRVVVKVGSNVLTGDKGLNLTVLRAISAQISALMDQGREVILVSSGAMASGLRKLELDRRPDEMPKRQAVSAVGQAGLIREYEKAFGRYGRKVAQILLTSDDLSHRTRYLNSRNTLLTLLEWQVVPIINENDTVAVKDVQFGDNDHLAALITLLMDADVLVILTDIEGLFSADPRTDPGARLIARVDNVTRGLEKTASAIPGALGRGGMRSKILAAQKVTAAGIPMVITKGAKPGVLRNLFQGKASGTFFAPKARRLASRKCWIAFSLKPKGLIVVDEGAAAAIVAKGKSLLPSGVVGVEGDFGVGAAVDIQNGRNQLLARGLVNYDATAIRTIMGLRTGQIKSRLGEKPYDEVVHRDNLAIMPEAQEQTEG